MPSEDLLIGFSRRRHEKRADGDPRLDEGGSAPSRCQLTRRRARLARRASRHCADHESLTSSSRSRQRQGPGPSVPIKPFMTLLIPAVSAYRVGQDTGLVLLLLALLACLLRAFRVLPHNHSVAAARAGATRLGPPAAAAAAGSVAPPDFAPAATAPQSTHGESSRRSFSVEWRFGAAALVLAALLIGSVVRMTGTHPTPWDSGIGAQIKAGFIAGCSQTGKSAAHCGCVFSHVTARAPYNTPNGFEGLATNLGEFVRTRDVRVLPKGYVDAILACRTTA